MSEPAEGTTPAPDSMGRKPDNLLSPLDVLLIIVRRKKQLIFIFLLSLPVALAVAYLLPETFTATARVIPSRDNQQTAGAGLSDLASLVGVSVGDDRGEMYASMARSRSVADLVIDKFGLMAAWDTPYRATAYAKWDEVLDVSLGSDDGILTIKVDDGNPELAAGMANAVVDELMRLSLRLRLGSSSKQRAFLEKRLEVVQRELNAAEEELKLFQEKNRLVRVDAQSDASIGAISKIQEEISSRQVQLEVLRSVQTENSAEVKGLREEIKGLKKQLQEWEKPSPDKNSGEDLIIEALSMPGLGLQYARLLRKVKAEEKIFEILTQQLELAKIEESRNMSSMEVLDHAVPPDLPSKPNKAFIVVLAGVLGVGFSLLFIFLQEYLSRLSVEDQDKWAAILRSVRLGKKA